MRDTIYEHQHPEVDEHRRIEQHVEDLCKEYLSAPLPSDPPPTAAVLAAWAADPSQEPCSSEDEYLGIRYVSPRANEDLAHPDIKAARACAIMRATSYPQLLGNFEGFRMLSILSANGEGTPQSWPAALRYACMAVGYHWMKYPPGTVLAGVEGVDDAILGGRGLVLAIDKAMKDGAAPGYFDGCDRPIDDPQLGSRESDACADFRSRKIVGTVLTRYADQQDHKTAIYGTADAFNDVLVGDSLSLYAMSVDITAILASAARERAQYNVVSNDVATQTYPPLGVADLNRSDTELNQLYKDMKCELGCDTTPKMAEAFQEAQRSWLLYRNAMVADAVAISPTGLAANAKTSVSAQMTKDRVDLFNLWISDLQGGLPVPRTLLSGNIIRHPRTRKVT